MKKIIGSTPFFYFPHFVKDISWLNFIILCTQLFPVAQTSPSNPEYRDVVLDFESPHIPYSKNNYIFWKKGIIISSASVVNCLKFNRDIQKKKKHGLHYILYSLFRRPFLFWTESGRNTADWYIICEIVEIM